MVCCIGKDSDRFRSSGSNFDPLMVSFDHQKIPSCSRYLFQQHSKSLTATILVHKFQLQFLD